MKHQRTGTMIGAFMLLVFLLACSTQVDAAGYTVKPVFSDVASGEADAVYIDYMAQRGLISGFPDGTFQPGGTVTRAQMAQMLVKSNMMSVKQGNDVQFTDVKPDHWAYKTVVSAVQSGFIAGYPDGTFRPESPATRAEVASMLLRLTSAPMQDVTPPSGVNDLSSHWALSQCAVVLDAGIMSVDAEGLFAPDKSATRADVVKGLALMLTLSPDQNSVSLTGTLVPKGQVQITRANGSIIDVTSAALCFKGDTIVTGNSTAELNFPDGSGLKIKENTQLAIKEAKGCTYITQNGQPGTKVDMLEIELPRGEIFGALASTYHNSITSDEEEESTVSMIQSNHSLLASLNLSAALAAGTKNAELPWYQNSSQKKVRVKVDMPWGVAAIRGTFWQSLVNSNGSGSTTVLTGECEVTAGGQSVMLSPGQITGSTGLGAPPSPPVPMSQQQQQQWNAVYDWFQQITNNMQDASPLQSGPPALPSSIPPAGIPEQILNRIQQTMPQFGTPQPAVSSSNGGGGSHAPSYVAVSSSNPVNGAQGIAVDQAISITFDRSVSAGTGYEGITLSTDSAPVDTTVSLNANVLTVTPSQPLSYNQTYTLTIPAAAVKDSNQYMLSSAFILNFSTLNSPPAELSVQSTAPSDSATGVAIDQVITINFNQAITEGPGYSDITLGNIEIDTGINGSTLTITPTEPLVYNTAYILTIPYNALRDSIGNVMNEEFTLTFTTGSASPPPQGTTLGILSLTRMSVNSDGQQTTSSNIAHSDSPWLSTDGCYLVFHSYANNLVIGDTNSSDDIFIKDTDSGAVTRVNVTTDGVQSNGSPCDMPRITPDGRYVVFRCGGPTNLATGDPADDTNGKWDILVHDRDIGGDGVFDEAEGIKTVRVSVNSAGEESHPANLGNSNPSISDNGRFICFSSDAPDLVAGDTNGKTDIFVHDRDADDDGIYDEPGYIATMRVSVSSEGTESNGDCYFPEISGNGNYIVFSSAANNLVPGKSSGIYLHNVQNGETSWLTDGYGPKINNDGNYIAFYANDVQQPDPEDLNECFDVYVLDRTTDSIERITSSYLGGPASYDCYLQGISPDGRFVTFCSAAGNLVPNDNNECDDAFIYDLQNQVLKRLSTTPYGEGNNASWEVSFVSGNGQYVAFTSEASNLVEDDTNEEDDIFLVQFDPAAPVELSSTPEPGWITITNNATGDDYVEVDTIPAGTIAKVYDGNGNLLGAGAAEYLGGDGYMPAEIQINNGFAANLTSIVVKITELDKAESTGTTVDLLTPIMDEGTDYEVDNCDHGYGRITYILTYTQKTAIETATGKTITTVKVYTVEENEGTFTDLPTAQDTGGVVIPITNNDDDTDDYVSVERNAGNYGYAIAAYDELDNVVAYYVSDGWITVY